MVDNRQGVRTVLMVALGLNITMSLLQLWSPLPPLVPKRPSALA